MLKCSYMNATVRQFGSTGEMARARFSAPFLRSASCILLLTAALKLIGLGNRAFSGADPVIQFLTGRELLVIASLIEIAVVVLVLQRRVATWSKLSALLWLSAIFATYKVGLAAVHFLPSCGCPGARGRAATWVSDAILACLFAGGGVVSHPGPPPQPQQRPARRVKRGLCDPQR